jgi:small-conductance mechanosensitive channel
MDVVNVWNQFQWIESYLKVVVVVIVTYIAIRSLNKHIKRIVGMTQLPLDIQKILQNGFVYFLWFCVLMYITKELNLQDILVPIIGASFLVGAAVAMAVKDILADALAGLFILTDKHLDIGDEIETMNYKGEIISVSLRKTRIRTGEKKVVILPNGKIDSSGWILYEKRGDSGSKS